MEKYFMMVLLIIVMLVGCENKVAATAPINTESVVTVQGFNPCQGIDYQKNIGNVAIVILKNSHIYGPAPKTSQTLLMLSGSGDILYKMSSPPYEWFVFPEVVISDSCVGFKVYNPGTGYSDSSDYKLYKFNPLKGGFVGVDTLRIELK